MGEEETGNSVFKAFEDENLELMFSCAKEGGETVNIRSSFNNKSGNIVSELVFQVAVLKYLKLAMNPINSNRLNPNSRGEASQVDFFFFIYILFFVCFFDFFNL